MERKQRIKPMNFKKYSKSLCIIFLSHISASPLIVNAKTATISNGTAQLTGQYELDTTLQSQSVVKITGTNTTVTGGDDVSITVNGPGSGVSLTNGSLTLTGSSITALGDGSSTMISNTNGRLNLSNVDFTTGTYRSGGIKAIGSNSVTTITNSRLNVGTYAISGTAGATITVDGTQIDSIGNYGIILENNSNLSGAHNIINMDGPVQSWAAIYAASNSANTTSTLTLDDTHIYVAHGKSAVEANRGGVINMTDLEVTGNVNVAVRANQSGNTSINGGKIILDEGAIVLAEGTGAQEVATVKLNNVHAESNAIRNDYEATKNFSLINGKAFSNIIIEGGSFYSKGIEQHGVSAMNDSSTISLFKTSIKTDTDKSFAIKSNGNITVKNSDISTAGNDAHALYSEAEIAAEQVNIATIGNNAAAVFSGKTGHVGINHATISTRGNNAYALEATNEASIDANNLVATTTGDNSHAILSAKTAYNDRQSRISLSDSVVTASGKGAAGIAAINQYNSTPLNQYRSDITLSNTAVTSNDGYGLYVKGVDAYVHLTNGSSLVADNGRLIYAEAYDFTGNTIPTYVSLIADGGTHLVGNVDFTKQSVVDMQLTAANWKMLSSSKVSNLSNFANSIIDLTSDNNQYNTLTVTGNYSGDSVKNIANNGRLIVNTVWDNDHSSSDLLDIAGTASGYTQVQTKNGIIGNVTRDNDDDDKYSVTVVNVGNHQMGANAFYGFADTLGAGQALLVQKDDNSYAWYLPKIVAPDPEPEPDPEPKPDPDPKPDPEPEPTPPVTPNDVSPTKPEVPGFTLMPRANMEMGYRLIGTLYERIGEQQTFSWDNGSQGQLSHNNGQVWGKMLGNLERVDGQDRYGYRSKMWGVRFGYDFDIDDNPENGSRQHSGVMLTYAKDQLKFNDRRAVFFDTTSGQYAEKNQRTGTGQTDTIAFGAYTTYYSQSGSYLDLVGNLDYSHNQYRSNRDSKSSNDAYGVALSAEVGQPYTIAASQWLIEPQAQLTYQYRTFSDFKTEHDVNVDQKDRQGLRGRAGFRLAYNAGTPELNTNTVYFVGNLIHDFVNTDHSTKIGTDSIKDKAPRSFGEIGGGLQLPIGKTAYMYIDSRYTHSLNNDRGKENGVRGNIGFKYHW
ncbi:Serine protease sat autotransporter precursor [Pragia fontium]|uniref:autotransporter outer membrane beta-barrel domain-containing protein n=1 Tax=Pragia fontium TaxID=82985 RepID=UPI000E02EA01|nr:autotransporter outer membrane beta-barrel domain-containing protein [Pragia fontium]SUB81956.1 Serine protease sat autotransporter precursor [Pragia fontium]